MGGQESIRRAGPRLAPSEGPPAATATPVHRMERSRPICSRRLVATNSAPSKEPPRSSGRATIDSALAASACHRITAEHSFPDRFNWSINGESFQASPTGPLASSTSPEGSHNNGLTPGARPRPARKAESMRLPPPAYTRFSPALTARSEASATAPPSRKATRVRNDLLIAGSPGESSQSFL